MLTPHEVIGCHVLANWRRLQTAFTIRGIANHLTTGNAYIYQLPAYLGLSQGHCAWYTPVDSGIPDNTTAVAILSLASKHFKQPLALFRPDVIHAAIACFPCNEHDHIVFTAGICLTHSLTRLEKAHIMHLIPNKLPEDIFNKLDMSLASLQAALVTQDPLLPTHLRSIHTLLLSYPESVQLLEDAEIANIIDGLEHQTKTFIVKAAAPKAGKKKVTADDL
jgi:hypothetical protein